MVMPKGLRSSEPVPVPKANGSAPQMADIVVIMMGRKRNMQALKIASRDVLPSVRSACSAKSIIMMAFFFTMPMSSMMPIIEMMLRSMWKSINASMAPALAENTVEIMVSG